MTLDVTLLPGQNLEERLRHGAYLVTRLLKAGRPVGLRLGAMEITPESGAPQKLLLLKALALYGQNQDAA